jgi:hypothetical protein
VRRVKRRPLLDRLLQRLEDRLGQPLPLDLFVENVDAKEVFDMRFLEIDAIKLMFCTCDRIDRILANVRTNRGRSSVKNDSMIEQELHGSGGASARAR